MSDEVEFKITKHAYERAKERFKWKPKTLDRMVPKAFENGITHAETKGQLKKYLDSLWHRNKSVNNIRIYGEDVYFFSDYTLITLYRIPSDLTKNLKYIK